MPRLRGHWRCAAPAISVFPVVWILLLAAPPAQADVIAYEQVTAHGRNDRVDFNATSCDPVVGCWDSDGSACNSPANGSGTEFCDVARVPEGRCSYGNSATCIWPLGAGHCADDPGTTADETLIACLPDDAGERLLTSGVFASSACPSGSAGCNVATNDPACECQGTDPGAAGWEGDVCTQNGAFVQALCSDGDPDRHVGGYGSGLCTSIFLLNEGLSGCGGTSVFPGRAPTSPRFRIENPPRIITPTREPGAGFPAPTTPIRRLRTTAVFEIDASHVGSFSGFGVRQFRLLGESWFSDPQFFSSTQLSSSVVRYPCEIPQGWATSLPIDGRCEDDPFTPGLDESTFTCVADSVCQALQDPNSVSPPLGCNPDTFVYCHEATYANTGLVFSRAVTAEELVDANAVGECPPDCGALSDFTTFENEALEAVGADPNGEEEPRATLQLALDHFEGPAAEAGDALFVHALDHITWFGPDPRCFVGGNADVLASSCFLSDPNDPPQGMGCQGDKNQPCTTSAECALKIGRCSHNLFACNPLLDGEAECGTGNSCRFCEGTYDGSSGPYLGFPGGFIDPNHGNATALPVGYTDPTGELDLHADQRIGTITGVPAPLIRLFLRSTSNSRAAGAEFRDGTCVDPDGCGLGRTLPTAPGGTGIGAGGTFLSTEVPTFDPTGPPFPFDATWAAEDAGVEDPAVPFVRAFDVAPGPDGIPGCLGDNVPLLGTACDRILGGSMPGSTGSDDVPLLADFSAAQDGSDLRPAVRAHFRVPDPLATSPVLHLVGTNIGRDLDLLNLEKNLDFIQKSHVTWCPVANGVADCTLAAPCAEFGGDADGDGVCDDGDDSGIAGDASCTGGAAAGCDDNCPTIVNPDQADADADGVGIECDNCPADPNPRVAAGYFTGSVGGVSRSLWSSTTGGQRDDDNDGYGNRCDGKFAIGSVVSGLDNVALLNSLGSAINGAFGTCGGVVTQCSAYDMNEDDVLVISGTDANYYLANLLGNPLETCPTCPLPCQGVCPDFASP